MQTRPVMPDVKLIMDMQGHIEQASFSGVLAGEKATEWLGRSWTRTVREADQGLLDGILNEARDHGVSPFRQVVQRLPSGNESPIEFTVLRLNCTSRLLAVGKSLWAIAEMQNRLVEAQQAMERDYLRMRDFETRYRQVTQASSEAIVLLDARDLRILESNPMADEALGGEGRATKGGRAGRLMDGLHPDDRDALSRMLHEVKDRGVAPGILVRLGVPPQSWYARASLTATGGHQGFLGQLAPTGDQPPLSQPASVIPLEDLMERGPDAFVVIDDQGTILRANQAFLDMVQMGSETSLLGKPLGRWLGRSEADLAILLANVRRLGAVRLFSTRLHGELGSEIEVEISAAGNSPASSSHIGVCIRNVDRRLSTESRATGTAKWIDLLTKQVGKANLRHLVDEAVEVIERHYIDAALELSGGNRTVAAELLGISRQSLYVKFSRYGLDENGRPGGIPPC